MEIGECAGLALNRPSPFYRTLRNREGEFKTRTLLVQIYFR